MRKFLFGASLIIVLLAGWGGVSMGDSRDSILVIREYILSSPSNGSSALLNQTVHPYHNQRTSKE